MRLFMRALGVCLLLASWCRADTLLIIPFSNASEDRNLDWVGESIAETIREALANRGQIALDREDRQEAFRRLGVRPYAQLTRATVIKIGQALDAEKVIYGEFDLKPAPQGSGSSGSLSISAHIVDLRRLTQGPDFGETGALEDLAVLQRHLAWQAVRALTPRNAPTEAEFERMWPQVRVDAIENYIRGLLAASPEQRSKLFNQAVRLQPGYSVAQFQLGMLAISRKDYKGAVDWLSKVSPSDANSRHATFYLGLARYFTGDYEGAQKAFEQVAGAVPLNEVINNIGAAQSRRNLPEALDTFAKALEGDSGDPVYHFNVGYVLWKQGKFDAAAERFRAVLDRNPQDQEATAFLGRCLARTPYRAGELREGPERIKTNYEESAWWQLKAVLEPDKP